MITIDKIKYKQLNIAYKLKCLTINGKKIYKVPEPDFAPTPVTHLFM